MKAPREDIQRKVREWLAYADYAITTRYPGETAEVTAHDAQRAIELAEQVCSRVRAALRELGMESI